MFKGLYNSLSKRLSGATDRQRRNYVLMIALAVLIAVCTTIYLTAPPKKKKDPPPTPVESNVLKPPQASNDLEALNRKFNAEVQKRAGDAKQREIAEADMKKAIDEIKAGLKGLNDRPGGITDEQLEKAIRSRVDVKVTEMANTGQLNGSRAGGFNAPPMPNLNSPLPGSVPNTASVPLLPRDDGGAAPALPGDAQSAANTPKRRTMRAVSESNPASGGVAGSTTSLGNSASAGGNAGSTNFAAPKGSSGATTAQNEVRAASGSNVPGAGSNASSRDVVEVATKRSNEESTLIPLGSMITGVTLTGIDAPTSQAGQKNPVPMLIRIKHESILPNRFRADLSECFVLASGFGSLGTARAKLRTNAISCVRTDGKVVEAQMSGYLIGEDGREGVEGRVVSKSGEMLRNTLIAGFLQAGATRLGGTATTNLIGAGATAGGAAGIAELMTGSAEAGAVGGAGQAIGAIAKMYTEMAKEAQPVVEILPGRAVGIVLTSGLTLRFGNSTKSPTLQTAAKR